MRGESRSTSKSPYKNNESKGDRPQSDPPCNKVYVTFLPEDIDEAKLRQVFSQCGNITRVFLKKKEDGFTFAHINYDTVDEARDAIEKLNKRRINNKNIKVQFGRQYVRGDSKDSRDGQNRNEKFGERDRFNKGQQSDTRKRFDNQGGFESRGRGRGRGGREGERGGFREEFGRNDRGGERGDRGPMKCFKCQGQGHISKNCPNGQGGQQKRGAYGGESKQSKPFKPIDKMSEDECSDY